MLMASGAALAVRGWVAAPCGVGSWRGSRLQLGAQPEQFLLLERELLLGLREMLPVERRVRHRCHARGEEGGRLGGGGERPTFGSIFGGAKGMPTVR